MAIPNRPQAFELLFHHAVPDNIIRHSIKVSEVAKDVAKKLVAKGKKVNLELLDRACLLHDIGKESAAIRNLEHEKLGAQILKNHGFPEVAEVILTHSLHYLLDKKLAPKSIEQKILHYADKRVMHSHIVSLDARLKDLKKRYPQFKENIIKASPLIKKLEKELLLDI